MYKYIYIFLAVFSINLVKGQDFDILTMKNLYFSTLKDFTDTLAGSKKLTVNGKTIYQLNLGYKDGSPLLVQDSARGKFYYGEIVSQKPETFNRMTREMTQTLASVGTGAWSKFSSDSNQVVFTEEQSGIRVKLKRFYKKLENPVQYKSPEKGIAITINKGTANPSKAYDPLVSVHWCDVTYLAVKAAMTNFENFTIEKNKIADRSFVVYKIDELSYVSGQPGEIFEKKGSPGKFMFNQVASPIPNHFETLKMRMESCLSVDQNGTWTKTTNTASAATWMNTTVSCMVMMYADKYGVSLIIQSFK